MDMIPHIDPLLHLLAYTLVILAVWVSFLNFYKFHIPPSHAGLSKLLEFFVL